MLTPNFSPSFSDSRMGPFKQGTYHACQNTRTPAQTSATAEDEAVERTRAQPAPGSPAHIQGQGRDGAAHPDSLRAPRMAQPQEAHHLWHLSHVHTCKEIRPNTYERALHAPLSD